MSAALRSAFARAFRRAALPLGWYFAVTLVLPLANGAAHAGSVFIAHALVVLVLPPVLIGLLCTIHVGGRALLGAVHWPTVVGRGSGASGNSVRRLSRTVGRRSLAYPATQPISGGVQRRQLHRPVGRWFRAGS